MDLTLRDRLAILVVVLAAIAGILTISSRPTSLGVDLGLDQDGHILVTDIDPRSAAQASGVQLDDLVVEIDGTTLIVLPQYIYASEEPVIDPIAGEYLEPPRPIGVQPAEPVFVPYAPEQIEELLSQPPSSLLTVDRAALSAGTVDTGWPITVVSDDAGWQIDERVPGWWMGIAIFVLLAWWMASGRAGPGVAGLAFPLATATATPFLVTPLWPAWQPIYPLVAGILVTAAMLPLAHALIERIEVVRERLLVQRLTIGLTAVALVAVVVGAYVERWDSANMLRFILVPTLPLFPGVAAARPQVLRLSGSPSSGKVLAAAEYAAIGVTPLMALLSAQPPFFLWLGLWFLALLAAGRFTIRPLVRLASRATLQRDLVVAATEAERARVAADIHDDALQELTLLIHRLDATGDTESAEIARAVSDRLRAICGDLRLPILDDLGVGPALDWLVLRIERLAGGEVRLERSDGTRPPPEVELAFFRVAQEALSNAVRHGRPPIVVRYATTPGGASLTIDDAGDGILPDAGERAEHTGHFGLLNMQQRAEAIGAILDIRRWPAGGTHVKLDWRAA